MLSQAHATAVFALTLFFTHADPEISLDNWFCGQPGISRLLSYNSLSGVCWKHAVRINHCCAMHDNCYDLQLGRRMCDDNFCDCLENATQPDVCEATKWKCRVVRLHGQQAYLDAASYKEPPDFVKIFPAIDTVRKDFQVLYEECPKVMLTIKSCSLMANLCLLKSKNDVCKLDLANCIWQAAIAQSYESCHVSARKVFYLLVNGSYYNWKNLETLRPINSERETEPLNYTTNLLEYFESTYASMQNVKQRTIVMFVVVIVLFSRNFFKQLFMSLSKDRFWKRRQF
ncbi:unnamed protein product [Cylicocyclus nassatus]|uniref:Phospholipase A(2) n=1 Tax=Cylicocyclus nassatus TaxID=53992 RepID=A0AA36M3S7_CYLNA|nr:unnamed protein product [Cylicocyclus nassatus]